MKYITKFLIMSAIRAPKPANGYPVALSDINCTSPCSNPNIANTTAKDSAVGTTGIDFSSYNVPLIAAKFSFTLATLVAR